MAQWDPRDNSSQAILWSRFVWDGGSCCGDGGSCWVDRDIEERDRDVEAGARDRDVEEGASDRDVVMGNSDVVGRGGVVVEDYRGGGVEGGDGADPVVDVLVRNL